MSQRTGSILGGRRHRGVFGVLGALACVVLIVAPFIGMVAVPIGAAFRGALDDTARLVLWNIRVPRVLGAALVGGALAVGGLVFQIVFRNVLATPYTLGVSSGASLGAALAMAGGVSVSVAGLPGSALAALLGGCAVVWLVDRLAARGVPTTSILLAGVVVSFFAASLISFLEYMSGANSVVRMSRWLMGGFESVTLASLGAIAPFIVLGLGVAGFFAGALNLLALGDELALGRGVDAPRVRRWVLLGTSVMVAAVVSVVGPIGFVGVVVPHTLRMILGLDTRILMPASFLGGAVFLVGCDTIARTIAAPFEIPVGVVTALIGGPYFLWLLVGRVSVGFAPRVGDL
jgi:iron complex transport system permease protein